MQKSPLLALTLVLFLSSCGSMDKKNINMEIEMSEMEQKVAEFARVELSSPLFNSLPENEKAMLEFLLEAADLVNEIFWDQAFGNKDALFEMILDPSQAEFARINYGPWDRLNNNRPFVDGFGDKPAGANFYPQDMTPEEFDALEAPDKSSLYTLIRRDNQNNLVSIPYHVAYKDKIEQISGLIKRAATYTDDEGLRQYLLLRAEALLSDDYFASDMAWMDMKTNNIDFIVGPIENYEDRLYGYKTAYEAFILLKDQEWSQKLDRFAALLPALQKTLPVAAKYKSEIPGSDSDLNVYDAVYYAGDCNAGSKTIAINLPNDEEVHRQKGSRKLQLKNSMKYKFDQILMPISKVLIIPEQQKYITFEAFFENTMFHEVAHGLGIKTTINGKGEVRFVLKEQYSAIEECKADILGLFLVEKLREMGEITEDELMNNHVTFVAGIFRSVRFGASSSHGKANMITFNYFLETGAIEQDEQNMAFRVNGPGMSKAVKDLSSLILTIQGDGDYEKAVELIESKGIILPILAEGLDKVSNQGIPKDIVFTQGKAVIGIQ